jgi:predicted nucleic acid-binding Zn ribbon protein
VRCFNLPVYVYEHDDEKGCDFGNSFEVEQFMKDDALKTCPQCGAPVHRIICPPMTVRHSYSNTELKDMGFTKLVRRDKGVYENVTSRDGESRIVEAGKPETLPDLSKTIED